MKPTTPDVNPTPKEALDIPATPATPPIDAPHPTTSSANTARQRTTPSIQTMTTPAREGIQAAKVVAHDQLRTPWAIVEPRQLFNRLGEGFRIWDSRHHPNTQLAEGAPLPVVDDIPALVETINHIEDTNGAESYRVAYVLTDTTEVESVQIAANHLHQALTHDQCEVTYDTFHFVDAQQFAAQYPSLFGDPAESIPISVYPTHVADHLFLSSGFVAEQPHVFEQLNIQHVINVTPNLGQPFEDQGVHYTRIAVDDDSSEPISDFFEQCCDAIQACQQQEESVLVHCSRGASRSVAVVAAFLVRSQGLSASAALGFLRQERPCANPNPGFKQQLIDWQQRCRTGKNPT